MQTIKTNLKIESLWILLIVNNCCALV